MKLRLEYNSPVILTYALISSVVLILHDSGLFGDRLMMAFSVYEFSPSNLVNYFQLVSHSAGHLGWNHLIGNFSFILILGPILEEKYGSGKLLLMIVLTALITGLLNVLFFDTRLLGASGIVFMLIILSGFSNFKAGRIPITLILIVLLYIGREVAQIFADDQVSQFGHILGGICGGVFGYILKPQPDHDEEKKTEFKDLVP